MQAGEYALDENRKLLRKVLGNIKPYSLDFIAEQRGCTVYRETGFSKGDRARVGEQALPVRGAFQKDIIENGLVEYGIYDVLVPWHAVEAQRAEAKAAGKRANTSALQEREIEAIRSARGWAVVIDDVSQLDEYFKEFENAQVFPA